MQCENEYCIYWENNNCVLDEISLDIKGCCTECIMIDIDREIMNKQRNEMLIRL